SNLFSPRRDANTEAFLCDLRAFVVALSSLLLRVLRVRPLWSHPVRSLPEIRELAFPLVSDRGLSAEGSEDVEDDGVRVERLLDRAHAAVERVRLGAPGSRHPPDVAAAAALRVLRNGGDQRTADAVAAGVRRHEQIAEIDATRGIGRLVGIVEQRITHRL